MATVLHHWNFALLGERRVRIRELRDHIFSTISDIIRPAFSSMFRFLSPSLKWIDVGHGFGEVKPPGQPWHVVMPRHCGPDSSARATQLCLESTVLLQEFVRLVTSRNFLSLIEKSVM